MKFLLLLALPAFALVDSYQDVPTQLPNWKVTAQHMDTGELRGCSAKGIFGPLSVLVERPVANSPDGSVTVVYSSPQVPAKSPGTDERPCGPGLAGTWRYNHSVSSNEICDGKEWRTLTQRHFMKAGLRSDGHVLAQDLGTADFQMDFNGDTPVVCSYKAWFQNVKGLEGKLLKSGKMSIRFDEPKLKPLELPGLDLPKVAKELKNCAER